MRRLLVLNKSAVTGGGDASCDVEAAMKGMEEQAVKFRREGAELYRKV